MVIFKKLTKCTQYIHFDIFIFPWEQRLPVLEETGNLRFSPGDKLLDTFQNQKGILDISLDFGIPSLMSKLHTYNM